MKKRCERFIDRHGVTFVMVLLFFLLVILPFLVLAVIAVIFFVQNTIEGLGETTLDTMSITSYEIQESIEKYENESMVLYNNGYVNLLEKGEELDEESENLIESALTSCCLADTGIHAAYLVTDTQILSAGANYSELFDVVEEFEEEIVAAGGKCLWYPTSELHGQADEKMYILARSLNSQTQKNVGILYLVLDESLVSSPFESLSSEYNRKYLIDAAGETLYALDGEISAEAQSFVLKNTSSSKNGTVIVSEGAGRTLFVYSRIWENDWYCVSEISYGSILSGMTGIVPFAALIGLLYILFLIIMLYVLQRVIFRPLKSLKMSMDHYAQGSLETQSISPVGVGELRTLSDHFNRMTARIAQLMTDYKEKVDEINRQKMRTMAAQLTPHFIYNALNTIKWMAVLNHQQKIQELTESLIYIFMNASRTEDENYCVRDELNLIRNYAVIQKARFRNFDLVIDVPEECMDCHIRKLMLQPVVENAIVHGLARGKVRASAIEIRAWIQEDLFITIRDEGVGFDVEAWKKKPRKDDTHTNIGLHNVEQIIALEFGEPYGMEIESTPGKGTSVRYRLPVIRKEEKDDPGYIGG